MVQFLEKEHKNFEKILYKSMAFENCANFLKATNMLIGRNPKNDFRVKHPFINQEFHVMISELDKCAERKQSFSFFNVKEPVSKTGSIFQSLKLTTYTIGPILIKFWTILKDGSRVHCGT